MATSKVATSGSVDVKRKALAHDEWVTARKELLAKEKEFTRQRDELSRLRRELPWEKVEKEYVFQGPQGKETLADLFDGKSQLVIYHFMMAPGWKEGCQSCSFLADHFAGAMIHLPHRDVNMVVVSRAPIAEIEAYKKRMGWDFKWVSSHGSDFNVDYQVSNPEGTVKIGSAGPSAGGLAPAQKVYYNYEMMEFPGEERPGLSVFYRDEAGTVFHTYSTYTRGLDILVGTYNILDMVPKGRDEEGLEWSMAWVRRHDQYEKA
jgi:predicted dithiol-disulfide oxidoreductase (DUF899 family)